MTRPPKTRRAAAFALAAALTACAGPAEPERLSLADLEPARREAVEAYREGGERWRATVERARDDESLARFLVDNAAAALVSSFERGDHLRQGREVSPYERARRALVDLGAPAAELLVEMVRAGDDVVAGAAIDALWPMGDLAGDGSAALFGDRREGVRRRAAELAGRVSGTSPEGERRLSAALVRAVEDGAWVVRAEAARAAGRRARVAPAAERGPYLVGLARALEDADATVVGAAADGLAGAGAVEAVPALVGALGRVEADVVAHDRVQRALALLVGVSAPRTPQEWWRLWLERRESLLGGARRAGSR